MTKEEIELVAKMLCWFENNQDIHEAGAVPGDLLAACVQGLFGEEFITPVSERAMEMEGLSEGFIKRISAYSKAGNEEAIDEAFDELEA